MSGCFDIIKNTAMVKTSLKILSVIGLFWLVLAGCEKAEEMTPLRGTSGSSGLRTGTDPCVSFAYPDTIFYLREGATDYVVSPVTARAGMYGASPAGLQINSTTGAINVSRSETGLKYRVFFVPAGRTDTCYRFVTISGIDYRSALYELNLSDSLATPYYNALTSLDPPCIDDDDNNDDGDDDEEDDEDDGDEDDDDGDDDGEDDDCEFDDGADDDDGDGTADEPLPGQEVIPQGVAIGKANGIINLRQTVANGTFGSMPVSGTSRTFKIYYRLNDASNKALNSIEVKLSYYESRSAVPQSILDEINAKNSATLRRAVTSPSGRTQSLSSRPPHIVIVGRYR